MRNFINNLLDNESTFGRIMAKCWLLISTNLLFIILSIPVITIGPALAALFHTMLKIMRGDDSLSPVKQYITGFKNNFKQAFISWLLFLLVAVWGYADVKFCNQAGGIFLIFKYAIYAIGFIAIIIISYMMPVIAAFADTLPHLMRNSVFFAVRRPIKALIILALNIVPLAITYLDLHMQPLYVFVWAGFGFSFIVYLESALLIKDFKLYLPEVNEFGEFTDR